MKIECDLCLAGCEINLDENDIHCDALKEYLANKFNIID